MCTQIEAMKDRFSICLACRITISSEVTKTAGRSSRGCSPDGEFIGEESKSITFPFVEFPFVESRLLYAKQLYVMLSGCYYKSRLVYVHTSYNL